MRWILCFIIFFAPFVGAQENHDGSGVQSTDLSSTAAKATVGGMITESSHEQRSQEVFEYLNLGAPENEAQPNTAILDGGKSSD